MDLRVLCREAVICVEREWVRGESERVARNGECVGPESMLYGRKMDAKVVMI
jgi:hypothetical protein